jgi:multimeric flavodoxin WrbA
MNAAQAPSATAPKVDDLRAAFVNCTLKYDGSASHTAKLMDRLAGVMRDAGASVDMIHALDHKIEFGMSPDMTAEGRPEDDWPAIHERIMVADILVIGTPIWLGAKSSVATLVIERLYASSGETNDKGQYLYYGKTAGCVVTGNEDGVKACSRDVLYALQHIGYTIPPQADCGWLGEIGPGPSYGDEVDGSDVPAGFNSEFTNKNATFMAWNLLHTARMLRDNDGIPAYGNTAESWTDVPNARQDRG